MTRPWILLAALTACGSPPDPSPVGPPADWWASVNASIAADDRAIRPRGDAFVSSSRGLEVSFKADGVAFGPAGAAPTFTVRLARWGRADAPVDVGPAPARLRDCAGETTPLGACARALVYEREGLDEWWLRTAEGVEQGWTVHDAPPGDESLRFDLRFDGVSDLALAGDEATFRDDAGHGWQVGGVRAWDAAGEVLDAGLAVGDGALQVWVDDRDATYPIGVDPIYTTAAWSTDSTTTPAFGGVLEAAGDVDADGYDDLLVAVPAYGGGQGRVYVYSGGTSGLGSWASQALTGAAGDGFATGAAGLGDVDGDGYDDIAVSAPSATSGAGRVDVFLGSASGLEATAATSLAGASSSKLGSSLSGAGDVDGDGYADLVVGATGADAAYVFHGASGGLETTATTTLTGTASTSFGEAAAGIGDTNGDGYDDLVIGAPDSGSGAGALALFLGSSTGVGTSAARTWSGGSTTAAYGTRASWLGDVNKDGYDDIIVAGTPATAIYLGNATSTGTSPASFTASGAVFRGAGDLNKDGYFDLVKGAPTTSTAKGTLTVYRGTSSGVSTSASRTITGAANNDALGTAVAGVGDVNADGYDDVVVGAPGEATGAVYVFHGTSAYIASTANSELVFPDASLGSSPAPFAVGDVNRDGYDDLAVGNTSLESKTGGVWLYHGSATGLGTVAAGAWYGSATGVEFGASVLAGRFNSDVYPDLAIGSQQYSTGAGRIEVFRGSATGIATTASGSGSSAGGSVSYDYAAFDPQARDMDGDGYDEIVYTLRVSKKVVTWEGAGASGASSASTSTTVTPYYFTTGDIDCDGYPEKIVWSYTGNIQVFQGDGKTSPSETITAPTSGYWVSGGFAEDLDQDGCADLVLVSETAKSLYVYEGSGVGLPSTPDTTLTGTSSPTGLAKAGDVNGDGYPDTLANIGVGSTDMELFLGSASGIQATPDGSVDATGAIVGLGDVDGDGYGDVAYTVTSGVEVHYGYEADSDGDGTSDTLDCDPTDGTISPSATESCNGVDDDCDGDIDEAGASGGTTYYRDADDDLYGDPSGAVSLCEATAGYVSDKTDCDDTRGSAHPGGIERCNGSDDDCDGAVDEAGSSGESTLYVDDDGDGYGDTVTTLTGCAASPGYATVDGDCDDADADVSPGTDELCNSVDDDCDGDTDEDDAVDASSWYADADGDTYGDVGDASTSCTAPTGYVADATDCDDADAGVYPTAIEDCDDIDQDCDGTVDEGIATTRWYFDDDGDGLGDAKKYVDDCEAPGAYVDNDDDCDDTKFLVTDGTDYFADADSDTYGDAGSVKRACSKPTGYVTNDDDCDDTDSAVSPKATETCNAVDDDCDGTVDEDDASDASVWFRDTDGDTYGSSADRVAACSVPPGYVARTGDCDDGDASVRPGATEACDDVDQDCDGSVDEGIAVSPWYRDADGDGVGPTSSRITDCAAPDGYVASAGDCDDTDADVGNGLAWYADADADSYGDPEASAWQCVAPTGYIAEAGDCDDGDGDVHPDATEVWYDGVDQDCDGRSDDDADFDGFDATSAGGLDCDDTRADVSPEADDTPYDGLDQDCDGWSDDDGDRDGHDASDHGGDDCDDELPHVYPGAPDTPYDGVVTDCDASDELDVDRDGYAVDVDCDDADAGRNPGVAEVWYDAFDQDCDGNDDDQDVDGFRQAWDCDDTDASVGPCETKACGPPSASVSWAWTGLLVAALARRSRRTRDGDRS